jgi:hypothetical protein
VASVPDGTGTLQWHRELLLAQAVILGLALITAIPGAPRRRTKGGEHGVA